VRGGDTRQKKCTAKETDGKKGRIKADDREEKRGKRASE